MATSFRGFGTKYYGEADLRADGSFVTTEFLILLHLPVAPLRSYRLVRIGQGQGANLLVKSEVFTIIEKLPIQWLQVVRIYLLICLLGGWTIFALWVLTLGPDRMARASVLGSILILVASFGFVMGPPYVVLWWFKRWEKRRLAAANPFTQDHLPAPSPNPNQAEARSESFHL